MLIDENETKFAIVGDIHGQTAWAQKVVKAVSEMGIRTIFQVGDFGIWGDHSGGRFIKGVELACAEYDVTIYVTLGNHEDYDVLATRTPDESGLIWFKDHIAVFPRPYRFNIGEFSVLSAGGAPSIDYEYRVFGSTWWPAEMITDREVTEAVEGGHADIMLAHDAPEVGVYGVEQIVASNPMGWSEKALAYAKEGRDKMTHIVSEVQPDLMFHGHYHVSGVGEMAHGGQIWSLNRDYHQNSVAILDIEDGLSVEWGGLE